jgi:hypothetical protein
MKIDEMPYTLDGRRTLTKLGEFTNVGEMYDAFLGNIPIGLAYAIQEAVDVAKAAGRAVTTTEIHAILREGVLSGDPLYNIRQVPGLLKQVINQTGKQTAYWASGHTRQFCDDAESNVLFIRRPNQFHQRYETFNGSYGMFLKRTNTSCFRP